jgi:hypothetical protein
MEQLTMKALIIYDDFELAGRANAMLQRTADQTGLKVKWDVKPWRSDTLKLPVLGDQALREAMDAHLIVIAICQAKPVLGSVMQWLEKWAAQRQIPDAALALLGEEKNDVYSAAAMTEFAHFASEHHLSFIMDVDFAARKGAAHFFYDSSNHKLTSPPVRPHLWDAPASDSHRHWGINE